MFTEADGRWRMLKFGYAELKTEILAKYWSKNFGSMPPFQITCCINQAIHVETGITQYMWKRKSTEVRRRWRNLAEAKI